MLADWEKNFCEELLRDGEILSEHHQDENHQYEIKWDDNNTFHITKDHGEWIYITRRVK